VFFIEERLFPDAQALLQANAGFHWPRPGGQAFSDDSHQNELCMVSMCRRLEMLEL
jgi:hypothetical protein